MTNWFEQVVSYAKEGAGIGVEVYEKHLNAFAAIMLCLHAPHSTQTQELLNLSRQQFNIIKDQENQTVDDLLVPINLGVAAIIEASTCEIPARLAGLSLGASGKKPEKIIVRPIMQKVLSLNPNGSKKK